MTDSEQSTARRPRVICHMMTSIDGRIVPTGWPLPPEARQQYEIIHATYDADAWICGRITMEPFAKGVRTSAELAREHSGAPRDDFSAPGDHESFAIAVDPRGRLAWQSNDIDGDHVIAILSQRVSDEYLTFLRERGVSYVFAGTRDVDLAEALTKIAGRFGVQTLMLEGGGRINGAMLHAGLIDELSVLVAPVVDGRMDTPALFDIDGDTVRPQHLRLDAVEHRPADVLWLRYRAEQA